MQIISDMIHDYWYSGLLLQGPKLSKCLAVEIFAIANFASTKDLHADHVRYGWHGNNSICNRI